MNNIIIIYFETLQEGLIKQMNVFDDYNFKDVIINNVSVNCQLFFMLSTTIVIRDFENIFQNFEI